MKKTSEIKISTIAITFIYLIAALIGIYHHELWMDELQAWQIASTARNLVEFYNNFNFEGHPPLWHILLFLISRFTNDPWYMQLMHVFISTASVYVLVRYSPFNLFQKIAWSFGYYSMFEYGIISRSYSLGVLLVFIFCAYYSRKPKAYYNIALILGLLINTSIYGILIAFGLFILCVLDFYKTENKSQSYRNLILPLLILSLFTICSYLFISKIDNHELKIDLNSSHSLGSIAHGVGNITNAYFTFPDFKITSFWETNYFNNVDSNMEFSMVTVLFMGLFSISFFKADKALGYFYTITTILIVAFMFIVFYGYTRHIGHLWIVLVCSMWLLKVRRIRSVSMKFKDIVPQYIFNVLLFIQLCSGVLCYYYDLKQNFSSYPEVGKSLNELKKPNVIIGTSYMAPIAAFMPGKKIFILEHQKFENRFSPASINDPTVNDSLITKDIDKLDMIYSDIYLVLDEHEIRKYGLSLRNFQLIKAFDGSLNISGFHKNIRIYKYSKKVNTSYSNSI